MRGALAGNTAAPFSPILNISSTTEGAGVLLEFVSIEIYVGRHEAKLG